MPKLFIVFTLDPASDYDFNLIESLFHLASESFQLHEKKYKLLAHWYGCQIFYLGLLRMAKMTWALHFEEMDKRLVLG